MPSSVWNSAKRRTMSKPTLKLHSRLNFKRDLSVWRYNSTYGQTEFQGANFFQLGDFGVGFDILINSNGFQTEPLNTLIYYPYAKSYGTIEYDFGPRTQVRFERVRFKIRPLNSKRQNQRQKSPFGWIANFLCRPA